MAKTETYEASVTWTGGHRGHLKLGNGPEMDFSAPPSSHGEAGVLTPEDAFVGAVNTCVMLMFIWGAERFKLDLASYDCRAEGTKLIELDRTEIFSRVVLKPRIVLRPGGEIRQPLSAEPGRLNRPANTASWRIRLKANSSSKRRSRSNENDKENERREKRMTPGNTRLKFLDRYLTLWIFSGHGRRRRARLFRPGRGRVHQPVPSRARPTSPSPSASS